MTSKSSSPKTPLSFLRSFTRNQKKIVNVAVLGGRGVGKSAFVVRFLTRRFIGDYSSSICSAYPHTVSLDNNPVAVVVWDTPAISTQDRGVLCEDLEKACTWADVILMLYSVTDSESYATANSANKHITKDPNPNSSKPCVILVGNKNDLWQDRQVGTDQACQEAEEAGFSNFFEITTRESLDQVRVVFYEGIRRGLACGDHRGYRRIRSISTESPCVPETSPESDDFSPTRSPKSKIIVSKHIMTSIKRKLMSPKLSVESLGDDDVWHSQLRTRSNTISVGRMSEEQRQAGPAHINTRYRKLSVFEPRSAST